MKRFLGTLALALWCALFYQVALKPPQPVPYTAEEREAWRPRFVGPVAMTNTTTQWSTLTVPWPPKHTRVYVTEITGCWTSQ